MVPTTAPPNLSSQVASPFSSAPRDSKVCMGRTRFIKSILVRNIMLLRTCCSFAMTRRTPTNVRVHTNTQGPHPRMRLILSKLMRRSLLVILVARIHAPSNAGRQRLGTSMFVIKLSSNNLNKGMPTETSKGEPLQFKWLCKTLSKGSFTKFSWVSFPFTLYSASNGSGRSLRP